MNNEQHQIINEVYENFLNTYKSKNGEIILPPFEYIDDNGEIMSKEEFINKCKTNQEFSDEWVLQIEERELSLEERVNVFNLKMENEGIRSRIATLGVDENYWESSLEKTKHNIPTKLTKIIQ
jgi:hypothetical protein